MHNRAHFHTLRVGTHVQTHKVAAPSPDPARECMCLRIISPFIHYNSGLLATPEQIN